MLGNPYAKLKGLPQVAQPQVTQPKAKKTVTINEEPEVIEIEAFKDEKVRDSIIEIEETEKRKATEEEFREKHGHNLKKTYPEIYKKGILKKAQG